MTDLELGPLRFGIVGAGRLGQCVARALVAQGFEVVHASSRSQAGRDAAAHALQIPVHEDPLAVSEHVDCVVLCVPDDAVAGVVHRLATRPSDASPMRLRVVSMSAAGGVAALQPLAALGHVTCVVHPVATLADTECQPSDLAGAGAGVAADDDAARTFAGAVAHALGLVPFDVPAPAWPLHAAACTLAANGVVAMLAAAETIAEDAGIADGAVAGAYARLAERAVQRTIRSGPVDAMAGPILRGDAASIARQIVAVRESTREIDALFIPVVATIANRAFLAGRLTMQQHRELLEAVLDPTQFDDGTFRFRETD